MDANQLVRFLAKVDITESCWEWTAYRKPNGYGQFYLTFGPRKQRRPSYAHRVAYEHYVGPIPEGLEIDHLCRNRGCVNPAHMEAVPRRVNVLRSDSISAQHARKERCPKGHPYSGLNNRGQRICRTCINERQRTPEYRVKHAADERKRRRRLASAR